MLDKLKIQNIKKILVSLLSNEENTKAELVSLTGLSNTTVSDCINNLLKNNFVKRCAYKDSVGGRRSAVYKINEGYGVFIGIFLEKSGLWVSVSDCCGKGLKEFYFGYNHGYSYITEVYSTIEFILDEYSDVHILSIGIGVEGEIDFEKQIVINANGLGLKNVHLKELLERRYMVPVYIDHSMNNLAIYEKIIGSCKEYNSFLCIDKNYSHKAGIFLNGTVLRGYGNMSGRISHGLSTGLDESMIFKLADFLDVECICLANYKDCTDDYEKQELDKKQELNLIVKYFLSDNYAFAKAAALMAELAWFESIYFLTEK